MSRRLSLPLLLVLALPGASATAHGTPAEDAVAKPDLPASPATASKPATPSTPSKPTGGGAARSLLWATVNVCDTADAPDTIGIRGSMPGSGSRRERMYMRFEVDFRDPATRRWRRIGPSGDSGWIAVGSGRYRVRESGRNFVVRPPARGSFRLRGTVTFEWRQGREVVRRAIKRTAGGHPGTRGADPPRHSAATCEVRA